MKCPYCEKEMQSGYIPTDNTPAQWIPDGKRQSFLKTAYAKDCKRIVSEDSMFGIRANVYYCDICGIILLKEER